MAGLIFFVVLAGWTLIVFYGFRFATRTVSNQRKQKILRIIFIPIFFFLPVADEIVGAFQFHSLCQGKKWVYDENKVRNKEVVYGGLHVDRLDDYVIPIEILTESYVDPVTDDVLISEINYRSGIGLLLRSIFDKPKYPTNSDVCYPDEYKNVIFNRLKITEVKENK